MAQQKYKKDDGGNLIDPPVIPDFERRLSEAHNRGDDDLIAAIQEEYNEERYKLASAASRTRKPKANEGSS